MGGGKGGGGGSTTQTTKTEPWSEQKPYLIGGTVGETDVQGVLPEAYRLYSEGQMAPDYYQGQTVADMSDYSRQAIDMQAQRALNGSDIINDATSGVQNIVNGGALAGNTGLNTLNQMSQSTNPYLDAMFNQANDAVQSNLNATFSAGGRYGSGAHEAAAADAANQLATQLYGNAYGQQLSAAQNAANAYNTGINSQLLGASTAQNLGNQAYSDAAALSEAGTSLDEYAQQLINADIDRYNYEQQQPLTALSNYNQLVNGTYGGTSTATGQQVAGKNTLGNALGTGLMGYGVANSMLGLSNPVSAGIGGLLGVMSLL